MPVRTLLQSRQYPGGVFDIVNFEAHPGDVYFVGSGVTGATDAAGYGTDPDKPFATLDYAIGQCTASKSDIIYLLPGHAETTTAIALDVAAVKIVGLGHGRNRPALTATTAATDLINVTAANCGIENVRLVGAASGVTALLDIAGDDFTGVNIVFEHGATPLSAVTVPGAFARGRLIDCTWRGTAAGPDYSIYFENGATTGAIKDWEIVRPRAQYSNSSGLDNAFIRADRKVPGLLVIEPVVVGFDTLAIDINSSSAAVGDGVVTDGTFIASAAIASIEDAFDVGGMMFKECYVGDAVTGRPGPVPLATVS